MLSIVGGTTFGDLSFGGGKAYSLALFGMFIALLGDPSSHGGVISTSNQDGRLKVGGIAVAAEGCSHVCPVEGHGTTSVVAITLKSYVNSKRIVSYGAVAGCGAIISPPNREVIVG